MSVFQRLKKKLLQVFDYAGEFRGCLLSVIVPKARRDQKEQGKKKNPFNLISVSKVMSVSQHSKLKQQIWAFHRLLGIIIVSLQRLRSITHT